MIDNTLTHQVIGLAMNIHCAFGPGLLESAYEEFLSIELAHAAIPFERQVPIAASHRGQKAATAFRADLVIDDNLIVEIKSVDRLARIHEAQILTYLRLSGRRVGLLLNFNTVLLKDGIKRFLNSPHP